MLSPALNVSSLHYFRQPVLIQDVNRLPGEPNQTIIGQFPGGAVEGFVGHAQEVRQFFTRHREGIGPGILHFAQEQKVTGDSRLGGW